MYLQPIIRKYHKGTYQADRMPEALDPSFVKIDGRTLEDLLRQSCEFSKLLNYYGSDNEVVATWQEFFKEIYDYERGRLRFSSLLELDELVADKPHLSLLVAFLRLFGVEQEELNALTARHLDFYYREMLGFSPQKGEVGRVTVFPQLNKGARQAFFPKGTRFDAGKDGEGNPIYFRNETDFVANRGEVASVMGYANGNYSDELLSEGRDPKKARFGFALSSPLLNLKDGGRTLTLVCADGVGIDAAAVEEVAYTSEEGWEKASYDGKRRVVVTSRQPAFAPYDPKIHGEGYDTPHPVLRFVVKQSLRPAVITKITAEVKGSKEFRLENDFGVVENKPMMRPFGMQPEKGSCLHLSSPMLRFATARPTVKPQLEGVEKTEEMGDGLFRYTFGKDLGWSSFAKKLYDANRKNTGIENLLYPESAPLCKEGMTIDCKLSSGDFGCYIFTPFGIVEASGRSWGEMIHSSELFQSQSYLYVGVEGLSQGDALSLCFRLDQTQSYWQNGGENDWEWDCLCGDHWERMQRQDVTSDTTDRLRRNGIVRLNIPDKAFQPHQLMPADKAWVRLSVPNATDFFQALEAVKSNAVELVFDEASPGCPVKGQRMPVSTITKPVVSVPGVKSIRQPFQGEEGKAEEREDQFRVRVSERLRHKDRAWTAWDYEHLVLEHFPSLAAARAISCVSHDSYTSARSEDDYKFSPGEVLLQLLPKSGSVPLEDPLRPMVSVDLMSEVEAFLKMRASAFVEVHAVNPNYAEIKVVCKLNLHKGLADRRYYGNLINDQLVKFIAPWSDGQGEVMLENRQDKSQIAVFLESLPYVDNIEELRVLLGGEECEGAVVPHNEYIILTSAKEHEINIGQP